MSTQTPFHLPVDLYSPEQLSAVIIELRAYISDLRDVQVRARLAQGQPGTPHASALLLGTFHEADVSPSDLEAVEKLQKQLEAVRDKAPAVHLMFAALPNRELKRRLTEWFRAEVHPLTLLTFATRTDIGGGVIIQAGSRIYNYSFREQILAHKHRISELYNHVR